MSDDIACPFVYANGRRCTGHIQRAKVYGPRGPDGAVDRFRVRKYRLWCSEKWDHTGGGFRFRDKAPDGVLPG